MGGREMGPSASRRGLKAFHAVTLGPCMWAVGRGRLTSGPVAGLLGQLRCEAAAVHAHVCGCQHPSVNAQVPLHPTRVQARAVHPSCPASPTPRTPRPAAYVLPPPSPLGTAPRPSPKPPPPHHALAPCPADLCVDVLWHAKSHEELAPRLEAVAHQQVGRVDDGRPHALLRHQAQHHVQVVVDHVHGPGGHAGVARQAHRGLRAWVRGREGAGGEPG